jgi:hypothetical protein
MSSGVTGPQGLPGNITIIQNVDSPPSNLPDDGTWGTILFNIIDGSIYIAGINNNEPVWYVYSSSGIINSG